MDQLHAQYETAMDSAIKDGLTGLYNHAYFKRFLEIEVKRAIRQTYSTALIMMDLDDFKELNDRLGHLAGDVILRESAKIIQTSTREIDLAVRYGGEEFAIVLPYAGKNNALSVAERIRSSIEAHAFDLAGTHQPEHMTISIGIATCPEDALSVEALIQKSDVMLYQAKKNGKNQICVHEENRNGMYPPDGVPVAPPELMQTDCTDRPI
jgi:two-component system cell cycle response regulator